MSAPQEIGHRVLAARPDIETGPPPLAMILARMQQEQAIRDSKPRRWWRRGRSLLPAVLIAAVLAGAGGGALLLSTGPALQPAFLLPANAHTGLGRPVQASLVLLPMRVSDPDGGPPWGMRVIRTTRGLVCLQAGRVVNGQLGGLGSGYAFDGDGLFHPFKAADAISLDACPSGHSEGLAFITGPPLIVTANALPLAGENLSPDDQVHCALPGEENWKVRCPQQELRQVAMGLLGPDATSIRVSSGEGTRTIKPYGPDGAYLIVLPAQPEANANRSSGAWGSGGSVSNAPGGATLTVTYNDGTKCVIPAKRPQQECQPHGFPANPPLPSSTEIRSPVSVRFDPRAEHLAPPLVAWARTGNPSSDERFTGNTRTSNGREEDTPGPALTVSFKAWADAEGESSGYFVELEPQEVSGCETPSLIVGQPTQETITAGETIEMTIPLEDSCPTSYTGRVFYASSTPEREPGTGHGEDEGPLYEVVASQFGPRPHTLTFPTVGTFAINVPSQAR